MMNCKNNDFGKVSAGKRFCLLLLFLFFLTSFYRDSVDAGDFYLSGNVFDGSGLRGNATVGVGAVWPTKNFDFVTEYIRLGGEKGDSYNYNIETHGVKTLVSYNLIDSRKFSVAGHAGLFLRYQDIDTEKDDIVPGGVFAAKARDDGFGISEVWGANLIYKITRKLSLSAGASCIEMPDETIGNYFVGIIFNK